MSDTTSRPSAKGDVPLGANASDGSRSERVGSARPIATMRAALLGLSAGLMPLAIAGCVAVPEDGAQVTVVTEKEAMLAEAAIQRRDLDTVRAFLRQYPNSRRVREVLSALPTSTLESLPPRVVEGIPATTLDRLPRRVRIALLGPDAVRARARARSRSAAFKY